MKYKIYNFNKRLDIHPSWNDFFIPLFKQGIMEKIFIDLNKKGFNPKLEEIFLPFSMDLQLVNCILICNEPFKESSNYSSYPFALDDDSKIPLCNHIIVDELYRSVTHSIDIDDRFDHSFKLWRDQGIMMIHSSLTTGTDDSKYLKQIHKSHNHIWSDFMQNFVYYIDYYNDKFIGLLGKNAQQYKSFFINNLSTVKKYPCPDNKLSIENNLFNNCGIFTDIDNYFKNKNINLKWVKDRIGTEIVEIN